MCSVVSSYSVLMSLTFFNHYFFFFTFSLSPYCLLCPSFCVLLFICFLLFIHVLPSSFFAHFLLLQFILICLFSSIPFFVSVQPSPPPVLMLWYLRFNFHSLHLSVFTFSPSLHFLLIFPVSLVFFLYDFSLYLFSHCNLYFQLSYPFFFSFLISLSIQSIFTSYCQTMCISISSFFICLD